MLRAVTHLQDCRLPDCRRYEQESASEPVLLRRRLDELLHDQDRDWAKVIEIASSVKVREIVNELKRRLDQYSLDNAAKADAAEAAASRGKTPVCANGGLTP